MVVLRLYLMTVYLLMPISATMGNHSAQLFPEDDGDGDIMSTSYKNVTSDTVELFWDLDKDQMINYSCMDRHCYLRTLNCWYYTFIWLDNCLNNGTYMNLSCDARYITHWTIPEILFNLREIEYQLTDIEGYKNISETYFRNYNFWKMGLKNESTLLGVNECYHPQYFKFIKVLQVNIDIYYNNLHGIYIYCKYIEIVLIVINLSLGVVMDGTLLIIFAKHKDMRTEPNLIILNIAICDFLGLFILPIQYVVLNGISTADVLLLIYTFSHQILTTVGAFSVLALSIQRYKAVVKSMKNRVLFKTKKGCKINGYLITIWSLEVFILLFGYFGASVLKSKFLLFIYVYLIMLGILLPLTVTLLNLLTSWNIKESSRRIPGEGSHAAVIRSRYRSSKIIAGICISYWLTHTPIAATIFYPAVSFDIPFMIRYMISLSYNLFCFNAFLNPLLLIICSKNYRDYFKRYLFLCSRH